MKLQLVGSALWRVLLVLIWLLILGGTIAWADYEYSGNCTIPYDTVQLGPDADPHTVRFCGRTYDPGNDESTWYYSVTSGSGPALSHWVLGLCIDHAVVGAGPGIYLVDTDPHTGIYGIKWESGFSDGETRLCWVTLEGNWEVEEIDVGTKAGNPKHGGNVDTGFILGPSCTPFVPPQLEVTVSGLKDLTIDQPSIGQWSATGDFKVLIGDPSDGTGLNVSVTANVSYSIYISYSYVISPAGSLPSPEEPLSYEYPTSGGTWYTIPEYPTNMATLHGLSGTATHSYPVAVDLTQLGDRTAGDTITFTIHVLVTQ